MTRSISHLLALTGLAWLLGCGKSYDIDGAFVSDKNHCFPDYLSIPVPTLVDPSAQSLSNISESDATYGQKLIVDKDGLSYGLQLRLVLSTSEPDASIQLYKVNGDGNETYASITQTMPDGSLGTYIERADFDSDSVDSAETWMDFPFTIPQSLTVAAEYWALITVKTTGMYWTTIQGSGFSTLDETWTVNSDLQGTIRSIGCENL